jgi:hypothetical protein
MSLSAVSQLCWPALQDVAGSTSRGQGAGVAGSPRAPWLLTRFGQASLLFGCRLIGEPLQFAELARCAATLAQQAVPQPPTEPRPSAARRRAYRQGGTSAYARICWLDLDLEVGRFPLAPGFG